MLFITGMATFPIRNIHINTSTFTLTPKDKIVSNSVIVDVIDKLLGMVENPILKKN